MPLQYKDGIVKEHLHCRAEVHGRICTAFKTTICHNQNFPRLLQKGWLIRCIAYAWRFYFWARKVHLLFVYHIGKVPSLFVN